MDQSVGCPTSAPRFQRKLNQDETKASNQLHALLRNYDNPTANKEAVLARLEGALTALFKLEAVGKDFKNHWNQRVIQVKARHSQHVKAMAGSAHVEAGQSAKLPFMKYQPGVHEVLQSGAGDYVQGLLQEGTSTAMAELSKHQLDFKKQPPNSFQVYPPTAGGQSSQPTSSASPAASVAGSRNMTEGKQPMGPPLPPGFNMPPVRFPFQLG